MARVKVLVLGSTGMLGSMVYGYLRRNPDLEVRGTVRNKESLAEGLVCFDAGDFVRSRQYSDVLTDVDYIVNCIGVIKPYCKDDDPEGVKKAILINALFPHDLAAVAKNSNARVIQIATDCVYTGEKGLYGEDAPHDALDVYGKTKSLGEVVDDCFLNIRCSIVGPEKKGKMSLLEWFLGIEEGSRVKGFSHHEWNGVTTLQFARLCEKIVKMPDIFKNLRRSSHVHNFVPNTTVNKYELLMLFREVFQRKLEIEEVSDVGPVVKRTLTTRFNLLKELCIEKTMEKAIVELRAYIENGYF